MLINKGPESKNPPKQKFPPELVIPDDAVIKLQTNIYISGSYTYYKDRPVKRKKHEY